MISKLEKARSWQTKDRGRKTEDCKGELQFAPKGG